MQEMLGRKNLSDQDRLWSFTRHQGQAATYQTDEWNIKATFLPGSHTRNTSKPSVSPACLGNFVPPHRAALEWDGTAHEPVLTPELAVLHKYAMSLLTPTNQQADALPASDRAGGTLSTRDQPDIFP